MLDSLAVLVEKSLITDFVIGQDRLTIHLTKFDAFQGHALGAFSAGDFHVGTAATSARHHPIYMARPARSIIIWMVSARLSETGSGRRSQSGPVFGQW